MRKSQAKAYAQQMEQQRRDDEARAAIKRQLDVIGPFRTFVIREGGSSALLAAIDDWVGHLCGDRTYFWSTHTNSPKPQILLPHERKQKDPTAS